jgi:hypothetical protein
MMQSVNNAAKYIVMEQDNSSISPGVGWKRISIKTYFSILLEN